MLYTSAICTSYEFPSISSSASKMYITASVNATIHRPKIFFSYFELLYDYDMCKLTVPDENSKL